MLACGGATRSRKMHISNRVCSGCGCLCSFRGVVGARACADSQNGSGTRPAATNAQISLGADVEVSVAPLDSVVLATSITRHKVINIVWQIKEITSCFKAVCQQMRAHNTRMTEKRGVDKVNMQQRLQLKTTKLERCLGKSGLTTQFRNDALGKAG